MNVALATDSFSHDLIEHLRLGALMSKISQHKVGLPHAQHLITSATLGAARALRRPDLGHSEVDARGGAVAIDLSNSFNAPVFDPLRALAYYSSGADVLHSAVDGQPVVLNHKVVGSDMDMVGKKAGASCRRIWQLRAERQALSCGY